MYRSSVTGQALGASKRASVYRYSQRKRFGNTLLGALLFVLLGLVLQSVTIGPARAQTSHPDLADLSLEELMNIEVTSVSKRAENLSQAAAAVYVLTPDDIRRSGATSIPEALRMVPGLEVAQMGSNMFAVTARGFNGTFANKLLVMIDGRSVYTPLFSGVHWDVQDIVLEDIDRIEVVRGPGATLWGANAVNGVINIITKSSEESVGFYAKAGAGSLDKSTLEGRYGFRLNEYSTMRVFGRRYALSQFDDNAGYNSGLHSEALRGGFRYDAAPNDRHTLTLQGDIYSGESAMDYVLPSVDIPYRYTYSTAGSVGGGNLLGRWECAMSPSWKGTLQTYFDRTTRDDPVVTEGRTTYDIDYQQEWAATEKTLFMWGLGYRSSHDQLDATPVTTAAPSSSSTFKWSGFVQADITVVPNRFSVTAGSKLEYNDYTGTEIQPSVRTAWTPSNRHSLWAAVSRAVRTPSRGEREGVVWLGVIPPLSLANPTPIPMKVKYVGTEKFESEVMLSYELGYRARARTSLWFDAALFYNDYSDLINAVLGTPYPEGSPTGPWVLPFSPDNARKAKTYGLEIAADWQASNPLRFRAAYTYIDSKLEDEGGSIMASAAMTAGSMLTPHNQFSLRTIANPVRHLSLDLWTRYVDRVPEANISSYVTCDARAAAAIARNIEIAVVGKDLFEARHLEFKSELLGRELLTERRFLATVAWRF